MSTNYHLHCLTCVDTLTLEEIRRPNAILVLCEHAKKIAALVPLYEDLSGLDVGLTIGRDRIPPSWFAAHAGHHLVAIDEYGRVTGNCNDYGSRGYGDGSDGVRWCDLPAGHDGPHRYERKI